MFRGKRNRSLLTERRKRYIELKREGKRERARKEGKNLLAAL